MGLRGRSLTPKLPRALAPDAVVLMLFPTVRQYRRDWLLSDAAAGLVLAAFLVPTGMGYATASGLPVEYGLYASVAALVAYFCFGPSQILVIGPDSALAPLVAAAVAAAPAAAAPGRASLLAVMAGALCLLAAMLRLGTLTDLISKPVRVGYLNGIAITVVVGQLPAFVGMRDRAAATHGHSFTTDVLFTGQQLLRGDVTPAAVTIGIGCLLVILVLRLFAPRVPGALVAVIGAAAAAAWMRATGQTVPTMVPAVPAGLPSLAVPPYDWKLLVELAPVAGAIGIVAAADTSVLSRAFPGPGGVCSPPNRELAALGVANLVSGLLQGFPVSSSSTRTPVVATAGARSQVAGLVAAVGVAGLIGLAAGLTALIPEAALAAVVMAACGSLLDVGGILRLARIRPGECGVGVSCLVGVVAFGVLPGILLAVTISLAQFIGRSWRPYDAVLGRVEGVKGYHDISRHPDARRIPGLVLFRWDAPLFFANAGIFRRQLLTAIQTASPPTRQVILAAEPITDIDTTASDMLCQLADELQARGISLEFAELKGPAKDELRRHGIYQRFGEAAFHPTIGKAVAAYLHHHQVPWQDWTD